MHRIALRAAIAALFMIPLNAAAETSDADLAKKLADPISDLISVPLQANVDCCYGPADGYRYTLNVQPVVPFKLGKDWDLVVRTILPIVYQEAPVSGFDDQFGVSDITQSFFFVKKGSSGGKIGIGPAFLWPVGTDALGESKWGAGPTIIALKQSQHITYGVLANHIWSYAGDSGADDISRTFVQPFFSYNFPDTTSLSVNAESSYDWETSELTLPVNLNLAHVYKIGSQRVQLAGGVRGYLQRPEGGPDWGLRFTTTFLFPKH